MLNEQKPLMNNHLCMYQVLDWLTEDHHQCFVFPSSHASKQPAFPQDSRVTKITTTATSNFFFKIVSTDLEVCWWGVHASEASETCCTLLILRKVRHHHSPWETKAPFYDTRSN